MSTEKCDLVKVRHKLHMFPELGFKEHKTKQHIAQFLRNLDVEVHEGLGVVGVMHRGDGGPAIGLRADMDALPIQEKSQHRHRSCNPGVMHACGHDGHMAMLLGAAKILSSAEDFEGTVVFVFQPNEELGLGAKAMLADGFLDQFPVDEIYAIHNLPGAPLGEVSTRVGLICSSESLFEIKVLGQGGHSSMPQAGREVITIGAELILALQTIVSRKLTPGAGAVVSVTEFSADGQRNVLPGQAIIKGDVRARSANDRQNIEALMRQMTNGIASAHGVKIEMSFNTEFVETVNSQVPTQAVLRVAEACGLTTLPDREPMSFSEDFAHFSDVIPGCFMLLGNGETGPCAQPLHSDDYDFNDALLQIGASFWANLVRDRLPLRHNGHV